MATAVLVFLFALITVGCAPVAPRIARPAHEPVNDPDSVAAINRALDDWHDAASESDEERYFDHFSEHAVFLGTDASERWNVTEFRAYAHPFFARGEAWSFRATQREIILSPGQTIAWFDEVLATENLGPARGSGVLVRDERDQWRIAQYNLAITIPNDYFFEVRNLLSAYSSGDVDESVESTGPSESGEPGSEDDTRGPQHPEGEEAEPSNEPTGPAARR